MVAALANVEPASALDPVLQTYVDEIACDASGAWTTGTMAWPSHLDVDDITGYEMWTNKLHVTSALQRHACSVEALQQGLLLRDAIAAKLDAAELDYVALVSRHLWNDEAGSGPDDNDSLIVWFWVVRSSCDAMIDAAAFVHEAVSIVYRQRKRQ